MSSNSLAYGITLTANSAQFVQGVTAAQGAVANLGQSARQSSQQLQMVGPQLTDFFTQIASGGSPMTAFIQQGGQLRDIFGGIGPAARAVGSFVAGLVNPFTLAAAAIAGIGLAYKQGSEEADEFRKTLLLSNNAVGLTVGQLSDISAAMARAGGTQSAAAEAVNVMAGSTRIGAGSLQEFAQLGLKMQSVLGVALVDTRKNFEDLATSPVAASRRLDEQYNYLTASVLRQISALQEQGKVTEAASLAQTSYANAMAGSVRTIEQNLGSLERTWNSLKSAAKGAWDAILNVGREKGTGELLRDVESKIKQAEENLKEKRYGPSAPGVDPAAALASNLAALRGQQADLTRRLLRESENSTLQQDANTTSDAQKRWEADRLQYLSDEKRLQQEIVRIRNEGAAAGASQAEIEQRIQVVRDRAPKKPEAPLLEEQRAFAKELGAEIEKQQNAEIVREQGTAAILRQKAAVLGLSSVFEPYIAMIESATDKESARLSAQADAERRVNQVAGLQTQSVTETEKIRSDTDEIRQQIKSEEDRKARLGLTARQVFELNQQELLLRATRLEASADIEGGLGEPARADALREQARQLLELRKLNGEIFPRDQWVKTVEEVGKGLTDSLFRAAEQGKSIFVALRDAIKGMFLNLTFKPMIEQGFKTAFDWAGTALKAFLFSANGNVFDQAGLVTAFANGGVVDRPTMFPFSGGTGVMGEAGPEAIMPLSRGPDGKLGVVAQAGSGIVVNQSFTFNGSTSRAEAYSIVKAAEKQTIATIRDARRRGNDNLIGA